MKLRSYQRAAIDAIHDYFRSKSGNPLVLAPTGSGKSVIIATFVRETLSQWSDQRILILTHVKELVQQNAQRLINVWSGAPLGIYSAALRRRDTYQPIIFASIQSIYHRAHLLGRFDLILVDECHLIPSSGEGMYNTFLEETRKNNPAVKVIGFTATPYRMKSGHLIGEGSLFTDIAYDDCDIQYLVSQGYLCPIIPRETDERIDMTNARVRGGDYVATDMQAIADRVDAVEGAADELVKLGACRRFWLLFCAGVDHALHVRDALRARGIESETVTGSTPQDERESIIKRYRAGDVRALTNCDVLTTGFDAPATDLIGLLRPTKSKGLYVQMVGRGMRIAEGKKNCLVLDFAGVVAEHGPVDQVTMSSKRARDNQPIEAPARTCPECKTINAANAIHCIECGHEFPLPERVNHDSVPDDRELLSWQITAEEHKVDRLTFSRHEKPGKPPSVKVSYWQGIWRIANEWVCPEHAADYPKFRAAKWWSAWVGGELVIPQTVDECLSLLGKEMTVHDCSIKIRKSGKYPEVVGWVSNE